MLNEIKNSDLYYQKEPSVSFDQNLYDELFYKIEDLERKKWEKECEVDELAQQIKELNEQMEEILNKD